MWANTRDDGGLIVVGQYDKGADGFEGCSRLSDKQLNQLEKTGFTFCPDAKCKPPKRVRVCNSRGQQDFVVLFRVHYHPHIVVKTVSGKVFVRIGDSKVQLKKPEEIRELQSDKGELSFECQDSNLRFPDDFDAEAIAAYVRKVRKERRLDESHSVEGILVLRHLGRMASGQFRPNYACALLFAKDPRRVVDGCKVRFMRFDGERELTGDEYNAVKDEPLEGTIPELIRQVEAMLDSQLRTFSPLDEKGKFYPVPEYPKEAWYEVVVNACVHRSYGNGMKNMVIFVKMFDDRLVVESPGPFPPYVTPQNIYDLHQPRNPKLMDAMYYMEYVKCAHEGTRRIRDSMKTMRLPEPVFRQDDENVGCCIVRVTLRNNIKQRRSWIDHDVSKLVSEAIAADLTEPERRVLNWVAANGAITISDANKLLETSWQSAKRLLVGLARKRLFQYIRFRPYEKNQRDPKAFFRLRSNSAIPDGAFEQVDLDLDDE